MTDNPTPEAEKPVTEASKPEKPQVSGNPALVEWPRDEWGTLAVLRKELLLNASNIRGNKDKHELYLATLQTAFLHATARYEGDRAAVRAEGAAEEARIATQNRTGRIYGTAVPADPVSPGADA